MDNKLSVNQRLVVFSYDDLLSVVRKVIEEREAKIMEASKDSVPEWGTIDSACQILKISKPTFHSMVDRGLIETRKIGPRRVLVNLHRLREAIETGEIGRYKHTPKNRG